MKKALDSEDESSDDSNISPKTTSTYSKPVPGVKKTDTGIGMQLRKSIMVGSSYQATIPELIKKTPYSDKKKPYSGEDERLWSPVKTTNKKVEKFLADVQKIHFKRAKGIATIPRGIHTRDDEQSLFLLQQCGFNYEKALEKISLTTTSHNTPPYWTEEQCKNFESGIRCFGKEFFQIHTHKVKDRPVRDLVLFYYLWKKSERHDVFAYRSKLDKKKYSLHPGVTSHDDYDNERTFKDSSFSNIQCLIYGNLKKINRAEASNSSNSTAKSIGHLPS